MLIFIKDGLIFFAGVSVVDKRLKTSGGRVVTCVYLHDELGKAVHGAYAVTKSVEFRGKYHRTDIARK